MSDTRRCVGTRDAWTGHMHVVATVTREGSRFIATCAESSVAGDGTTRAEALASLRAGLAEALRPVAVGPPADVVSPPVDITVEEAHPAEPPERYGPGEA